jgi:hypothetical protein
VVWDHELIFCSEVQTNITTGIPSCRQVLWITTKHRFIASDPHYELHCTSLQNIGSLHQTLIMNYNVQNIGSLHQTLIMNYNVQNIGSLHQTLIMNYFTTKHTFMIHNVVHFALIEIRTRNISGDNFSISILISVLNSLISIIWVQANCHHHEANMLKLSPLMLRVRISIRAKCTTLCDKVCQWLATGRWFSPVSSINKADHHNVYRYMSFTLQ